jgi:hypothetical protein
MRLTQVKAAARGLCHKDNVQNEKEAAMSMLTFLIALAALATLVALVGGVASMAHGGEFDRRHSHQFMFARVALQALAFVLLLGALLIVLR